LASGLETGPHERPTPPEPPDELGFIFGGDRYLADETGQGDPWGFGPLLSCGAFEFGSAQPGHSLTHSALDDGEAVVLLDLGTHTRQFHSVLPDVYLAAIHSHQRRRNVNVLVATCAGPVPDRHPCRWLYTFGLEAQSGHDPLSHLGPLVVDNETICLGDRQRRMPNVASQRVRLEPIVRRIDCRTQAGDLGRAERSPLFDAADVSVVPLHQ
jgi:hypothetical protein